MNPNRSVRWVRRPEGSNWGEFGADDQLGRMNLLTDERRLAALREITAGKCFCLSLPLDYPGGAGLTPRRKPPHFIYEERTGGHGFAYPLEHECAAHIDVVSDDAVLIYLQYSTQWDALSHVGQMFDADGDGVNERCFYNGFRGGEDLIGPDESDTPGGALALGIEGLAANGVQGRAVLVDLHSRYGNERVALTCDMLLNAIAEQKIEVRPGDFLCLYTGFADLVLSMKKEPDSALLAKSCAVLDGRDEGLLQWISDSGIVAICSDNFAVEGYPAGPTDLDRFSVLPLHNHCLFKMGIHLGELWYFAELAKWLRENRRNSFFLTAPPLRLPGAVGSPVTPIATV